MRVEGVVQGVGFRPYVFRLAEELGLAGFVLNDVHGVLAEVEGEDAAVARFLALLPERAPPLARVEGVAVRDLDPVGDGGAFAIVESVAGGTPDARVSPDTATCDDCLAELSDPADRRFRYPFLNCTNCGPRFTIVRGVPYDRPATTMASFAMCAACRAEYDDPRDRRFHAQPNACPACGPRARLLDAEGREIADAPASPDAVGPADAPAFPDAVAAAAAELLAGRIVAVKGVGGYHLACRADEERVVAALRARKRREQRPFALMVASVAAARALVELGEAEERLLCSRARPIVLAARRADGGAAGARVADAVAPGAPELGLMLPYTPLHQLLLTDAGGVPLVMTSGNVSDEPIAFDDAEALRRLGAIADLLLVHDRPIATRTDDSVMRVVEVAGARRPLPLRRSRGFVPDGIALPLTATRPILACGAELKSTFCLAKGTTAWVGHHIGDLQNYATERSFRDGIAHFERLFAVTPQLVAHDLHPDYRSTAYALEREGVETVAVQHHHAHLAACLAEHGETGTAVGAIYDGTGLGTDGTVWGGELLLGDLTGFARVGSLPPVSLPGGDRAAREPWRMACAWLIAAREDAAPPAAAPPAAAPPAAAPPAAAPPAAAPPAAAPPPIPPALAGRIAPERWAAIARMAASGFASPPTTSMGRLFDAVAALCGMRAAVAATYEGQAAIELEAIADRAERGAYELPLAPAPPGAPPLLLYAHVTIRQVVADLAAGTQTGVVSARFHRALATATATACAQVASDAGTDLVVLSGGVFQNRLLLEETAARLQAAGLHVLVPLQLPPNDGGISYGQAAVAAARDAAAAA
ncbi:(NiFe) hydrogenase maturation protein HypF [Conexibacter woesei DSM 14684]|uniref:Carbamoyltransferase n=1 Tax=Conexibacter woesei (strain DSM 14684 / CCUG 47730 / CIP 108061 / JCM 11494 / NBRC 100937 / ID131577) TaxID=469383 RepID=D3F8K8_CONWI|nr:(NiFe) hydrogenase maturation protein HypF [Conexibacter woesei DSM 14684]